MTKHQANEAASKIGKALEELKQIDRPAAPASFDTKLGEAMGMLTTQRDKLLAFVKTATHEDKFTG